MPQLGFYVQIFVFARVEALKVFVLFLKDVFFTGLGTVEVAAR